MPATHKLFWLGLVVVMLTAFIILLLTPSVPDVDYGTSHVLPTTSQYSPLLPNSPCKSAPEPCSPVPALTIGD